MKFRSVVVGFFLPFGLFLATVLLESYFDKGSFWVHGLLALLSAVVATIVFFRSSLRLASMFALGWLVATGLMVLARAVFDTAAYSVSFKDILRLQAGGVTSEFVLSIGLGAILFLGFKLIQKAMGGMDPALADESDADLLGNMRDLARELDKGEDIPARDAPYLLGGLVAAMVIYYFFGRESLAARPSDLFVLLLLVVILGVVTFKKKK